MVAYRKRAIEARYRTAWGQLRGPVPIRWWQIALVCVAATAAVLWVLAREGLILPGGPS